jgi:hypothetical protein
MSLHCQAGLNVFKVAHVFNEAKYVNIYREMKEYLCVFLTSAFGFR